MRTWLLPVVASIIGTAPLPGQNPPLQPGTASVLNATIDSVMQDQRGPVPTPLTRRLWLRFDSVLVLQLNAGRTLGDINGFLSRLSHFARHGGEPGARIGGAIFYREPPRFAPTYFAAQLGSDARGFVLAVFCYPWVNGPSHLAIYKRQNNKWLLSDTLTSDAQIHAVGTHSDSTTPILAALETYVGGDGTTSAFILWRLQDGRLIPVPDAEMDELRNADLASTDTSIEVRWTEHVRILDTGELGMKRWLQASYVVHGTHVATHTASLNPWLDVVEHFISLLGAGRREDATNLTDQPDLVDSLQSMSEAELIEGVSQNGTLGEGIACVVVAPIDSLQHKTYWRLYLQADSASTWRIVGASSALRNTAGSWAGRPVIGRRLTSACS